MLRDDHDLALETECMDVARARALIQLMTAPGTGAILETVDAIISPVVYTATITTMLLSTGSFATDPAFTDDDDDEEMKLRKMYTFALSLGFMIGWHFHGEMDSRLDARSRGVA